MPAIAVRHSLAGSLAVLLALALPSVAWHGADPACGLAACAWADSAPIAIDDITIDLGIGKYIIKHMEVAGSSLSEAEIKALFTGKSDNPVAALGKLNASGITIPEVRLEQDLAGVKQTVVYHDIKLSNIVNGKVASLSMGSASIDATNPMGDMKGQLGAMTATDLDGTAMARVLFEKSTDPNAPLLPVQGSFSMDGYSLSSPVIDMKVGKMTGHDFKMRPLSTPMMEMLTHMTQMAKPGEQPSPEQMQAMMSQMKGIFEIYGAIAFADMDVRDISVSTKIPDQPPATFSIGHMGMAGYANSRIAEMKVEGIDVGNLDNGKFHLGGITLKGFDFGKSIASMAHMMEAMSHFDPANPPSSEALNLATPTADQLTIADIDADLPSPPGEVSTEDQPVRIKFKMGKLELKVPSWVGAIPSAISGSLEHLVMDVPKEDPKLAPFAQAGIDKLDVSSSLDMAWSEAQQQLSLNRMSLDGESLGSVEIAATVGNVPKELFAGDEFARQAAMLGVLLKSVDIKVENKGLFEKALAANAKEQGQDADAMRKDLITAAQVGIPNVLGNSPAAKDLADAVAKFIADPKRLHISATSKDGIGASDAGAPDKILDKVDLKATVNE